MPLGVHSRGGIFRFFTCHHFFSSQLFQNTFPYKPFSKGFLRGIFPVFALKNGSDGLKRGSGSLKEEICDHIFYFQHLFSPFSRKKGEQGAPESIEAPFRRILAASKNLLHGRGIFAVQRRKFCCTTKQILRPAKRGE